MKLSCKVIEDLLPMYYDKVCSEETAALIEDHLKDCPKCSRILADLRGEIEIQTEHPDDIKPLKKIQKSYKKRKLITLVVILLVVALLPVAFYLGNRQDEQANTADNYSQEEAISDADQFMAYISNADYTSAFTKFDISEKKREWQRDFFSGEVLANFEMDALNAFSQAGASMEALGGFGEYQLKDVSASGYDNYGNKTYYISYNIEFANETEGIRLCISKRGIQYYTAGDSSIEHPLTSFCYWGQSLYESYLGLS